jgi:RNase H-like domain found in reverse transcriptase/Reverse transcriptase (RNA-dependent DNA polymerase)/Integrase zinc binding domain/Integrase core domain/gag-polyprotein putative aspartyl protease
LEVVPERSSENSFKDNFRLEPEVKIFFLESLDLVSVPGEIRPFINVSIIERPFVALLDSGAAISLVSDAVANYVQQMGVKASYENIEIRTADGTIHSATRYFFIPVRVDDELKVIKCHHVPSMTGKLLLGMNFWKSFNIIPSRKSTLKQYSCSEILVNKEKEDNPMGPEPKLTPKQMEQLQEVIDSFPKSTDTYIGRTELINHHIDTGDSPPVVRRPYLYSPATEKQISEEVDRWLEMGVVKPSKSSWVNPLVAVPKANSDKKRVCVDARFLNKVTKKDQYPLPNINRMLARVPPSKFFAAIDLKDAYLQVPLDEESKEKTAFAVPGKGFYQFEVMCFGLCDAPKTQQRLMDRVLGYKHTDKVFCYLDDIFVFSESFEEHLELLKYVAECLKTAGLTINVTKSKFCLKEIKMLGNLMGEDGLKSDPEKYAAILNYPVPKTVRAVRSLIGTASWFRKFIPNFSAVVAPITDLIKKKPSKIQWNPEAQQAFETLKTLLISSPILVQPRYDRKFYVECDGSDLGIGAVLMQKDEEDQDHVISYFSRKLTKAERKFSVTERECLAVIEAIKKFRSYIEGSDFEIITDHASLIWLINLKDPTGRLGRWAMQLQAYVDCIRHRPGKDHIIPDALSRAIAEEVGVIDVVVDQWYTDLYNKISADPDKYPKFQLKEDKIYKKLNNQNDLSFQNWRLVVPGHLRPEVLRLNHDECAHFGMTKVLNRLKQKYYWPAMKDSVRKYINQCTVCKQTKDPNTILRGPMGGPRIPKIPMESISIDYKGPMTRSKNGNSYVLVVVCNFSKYVFLFPMRSADAIKTISLLENEVFLKFSVPNVVLSDNGPQFKSNAFYRFCLKYKVKHHFTPYYHAQANQSERVNRVIGAALQAYVGEDQRTWDENLPKLAFSINTSIHESHKHTPFEVVFGRKMRVSGDEHDNNRDVTEPEMTRQLEKIRKKVRENLFKAYEQQSKRYNLRTRDRQLNPGDLVYRRNFKLSNKGQGYSASLGKSFLQSVVVEKVGQNRYKLKDLSGRDVGVYDIKDIKT